MTAAPVAGARASLTTLLRDGARLDRTQSDPLVSLRNAVGVAAPLAIGAAAGDIGLGLAATIGALQTAFADRPGPYLLRTLRMLGVAVAAGTTSALAVAFSDSQALAVLLLLVLALGAGLLLTAGPSATQFGIATTAAALVLGHLPQPPSVALHVGLLVVAGGALQTALAVAAWPLGRHRPERVALATLYRDLASAARAQHGSVAGPPAGDTLGSARATLYGLGHDHGPSVEAYRVLLDEAERIRREIILLTASAERLAEQRNPILAGLVRGALTAAGDVLDEVATALTAGRAVDTAVLDRTRANVRHVEQRLEASTHAPAELTRRATAARLRALGGQLRAVVESSGAGASEGRRGEARDTSPGHLVRDRLAIVRANITPDSAVLRHAVRLAMVVAGSDLVVRLLGIDRGYWVALTLLVVMRPDFGATLQRSAMRTVGTVIGLLVASELVHWVPGGDWWHVALVGLFAFGMRLAGPGNVALSAVSLSALIVVLFAIQGVSPHDTIVARSLATLVGGVLAVLAVLVLPAWERNYVPRRLAELLRAYRGYLDAIVDPLDDRDADRDRLQATRAASRLARTNAQASVDRARAEPVPSQAQVELGRTVLAHTHRFVHATLGIDTVRKSVREAGGLPALHEFVAVADEVLESLAAGVATGTAPAPTTKLRPVQERLVDTLTANPDLAGDLDTVTTLAEATDRITNSLDTLMVEVRRQVDTSSPGDRDRGDGGALASGDELRTVP